MATADVVALQLEKVKGKPLARLFHVNDVFWGEIKTRDVEQVSSREMRIPLEIRPGSRFGAVNLAGGALGRGTASKYDKATLTPIASRVAVEMNEDEMIQTEKEGEKAIVNLVATRVQQSMEEMRVQLNASLQTAGDGVLATIAAGGVSGNDLTMDTPFYAQLLREGQKVSVYNSALTTKRGEAEITKIDFPNNKVTVDAEPGGTIAGDKILPEGLSGANPAWYFGIQYHVSDAATGTWLGFSRSTEPAIRAHRVNLNSNALTTPPIRLILNKILQRVGMVNPKNLVAHLHTAQQAAYEELATLISEIRKTASNEPVDLLFGEQRMAGVRQQVDIHAARNRIDFLNLEFWGRAESHPVDFLRDKKSGQITYRPYDSTTGSPVAAMLWYIIWFGQIFVSNPVSQGYLSDASLPSGYSAI